jgi:apolipoprotein D and lipocalin family protein
VNTSGERPAGTASGDVVPHVDLERYLGTWYEIATIPQRFQKGCVAVTADYSLRNDGDIAVVNACRQDTFDGRERKVRGKAWVTDSSTNAKLKVRFFWPFSGPYWIIGLDPDYDWAIVGHPRQSALWILSRSPTMEDDLYEGILRFVADRGYAIGKIKKTPQPVPGVPGAVMAPLQSGAERMGKMVLGFSGRPKPAWMKTWPLVVALVVAIGALFGVYPLVARRYRG